MTIEEEAGAWVCGYYDILSCVQLKQTEAPSVDDIKTRIVAVSNAMYPG